ncbi:MAG TPA: hypothetical protein VGJ04_10905 [Pirellulales bacterium]|jgi:hypothetical protein
MIEIDGVGRSDNCAGARIISLPAAELVSTILAIVLLAELVQTGISTVGSTAVHST